MNTNAPTNSVYGLYLRDRVRVRNGSRAQKIGHVVAVLEADERHPYPRVVVSFGTNDCPVTYRPEDLDLATVLAS